MRDRRAFFHLRRPGVLLAVVLLLAALVVETVGARSEHPARPVADSGCTAERGALTVDGRLRTYTLCRAAPSRPGPLLVALHGMAGSGARMLRQTGLGIAAKRGVAVVLPDGLSGAWNDGRLGPTGPDDEAYVLALVRRLVADGVADPHRITLTGFSNGADFALVLAARYPRVFDAVVTVSGHLQANALAPRPTRPIPAYLVFGADDTVQPFVGRPARGRLRPAMISGWATAQAFAHINSATWTSPDAQAGQGTVTGVARFSAKGRAPVELIEVFGVGHVWPRTAFDATALAVRVASSS